MDIMTRMKFSNREIDHISHLIGQHMFSYDENWTDPAVRRFIKRVGTDYLEDLFSLRLADYNGTEGTRVKHLNELTAFSRHIDRILAEEAAFSLRDLAVNGKDLMRELQLPPGRHIGVILNELLETVLDDPSMNTREILIPLALRFYEEHLDIT